MIATIRSRRRLKENRPGQPPLAGAGGAIAPAVRWVDGEGSAPCPVCGSDRTRLVAEVDANALHGVVVEQCAECGSLRLVGPELHYSAEDRAIDDYVEGGAGLDAMALALCRAAKDSVRRFLDVGCYYGFGVHLAEHLFGWEAVGVEPSGAGERGRAELGSDIRTGRLDAVGEIGRFDLVLASEVVEHVSDPLPFLVEIREHLSPAGLLVLTTPAAEVVAPPLDREAEVVQALSPGHHRFLASVKGLKSLLDRAGFSHHEVVRHGATLEAVAATSADALDAVDRQPLLDQHALVAYLDRAAEEAPPASALANGFASRHLRAAVMLGDFEAAERSFPRARAAMLTRRGFDLDDPAGCAAALRDGRRPAWNLAGSAYAMGMLEYAGRGRSDRAARYFELAAQAAVAWSKASGTLDLDTWTLRELSLGHLCLALARHDPAASTQALGRLADVLDERLAADAERVAWWKTRTFNELVAAGHLGVEPGLVDAVQGAVEPLARSPDPDYRRAGLDALFLLGIRALNTGSPSVARAWFACCAGACKGAAVAGGHERRLARDAHEHDAMAAAAGGWAVSVVAPPDDDPRVVVGLDAYWSDASGLYLRGYAHAGPRQVQRVTLCNGERRSSQRPAPRPDVAALSPGGTVPPDCGFALYVEGLPAPDLRLELETGGEVLGTHLALPGHPLPVLEEPPELVDQLFDRVLAESRRGPVLTIGGRLATGTDLDKVRERFGGRTVFNVDIHPGLNVDVVGDVHRLSRFFRPGSFAAAVSASLLEHVVAPWLVAAELNRVLAEGALVLQVAPTTWPEHATPNDFWRFTAGGLAVLFGPATGFEVIEAGGTRVARVHPGPQWRKGHLDMPTVPASDHSFVLARKTREVQPGTIAWPYDPVAGERVAKAYPVDALERKQG
jgi:SAM-dependent methyltransferase